MVSMLPESKSSAWISQVALSIMMAIVIVMPVLVIPAFDNFFLTSKNIFLSVAALIIMALFWVASWYRKYISLTLNSLIPAVLAFGVSVILSIFFTGVYPVENLLGMGGMYLAAIIVVVLGGSLLSTKSTQSLVWAFAAAGTILAATTLAQVSLGLPARFLSLFLPIQLESNPALNLAGSTLIAFEALLVFLATVVTWAVTRKSTAWWVVLSTVVMILGLAVTGWQIMPGQAGQPVTLPLAANWSIAIDVLRNPRAALIGVGTDSFEVAFNQFKPASLNSGTLAGVRFIQGTNTPLTLWITTGLLGLATWVWFAVQVFRTSRKSSPQHWPFMAAALVAIGCLILWPSSPLIITLLAVALAAFIANSREREARIHALTVSIVDHHQALQSHHRQNQISLAVLVGIGLLIVAISGFGITRAAIASYYSLQALIAAQQNDAVRTYTYQQKATQFNPYMDSYRSRYAQTNIQIAAALANKSDITENERTQVSQLIQQAIREARAATFINPGDSVNWQVLAQIYRQLIGVANDAEQWTVSAYTQAIVVAPTDPYLRFELGGVFYSQNQDNQAVNLFQQAIQLKPDYANAYYNLGNVLQKLNLLADAKSVYEQLLTIMPADSPDREKIMAEIQSLTAAIEATASAKPSSTRPAASPNPVNQEASRSALTDDLSILNETVNADQQDTVNPGNNQVPVDQTTPLQNSDLR